MPPNSRKRRPRNQAVEVNGPAIAAIRNLMELTQGAVAKEVGITDAYLCQLENGQRTHLGSANLGRLARALCLRDKRAIMARPNDAVSMPTDDEPNGAAA